MILDPKKERRERTQNRWDMQKATSEMGDLNLNISIMTLNVNRLNSSHKGQSISLGFFLR